VSSDAPAALYSPFEPGFVENPYPQFAALREHDPVHETLLGFWGLFRYDDVFRFIRDPQLSVAAENAFETVLDRMQQQVRGAERRDEGSHAMLNVDPPDHTRLRRLVSKAFTPRRIEALRPRVQELVDDALDKAAAAGSMDLIPELAFPLPFAVISEMLGVPDGVDANQLREWSGLLVRTLEPPSDFSLFEKIAEANDAMRAVILDIIAWKRQHPADDLLTALVQAEEQGDMLSDEELLDQVMLIYIAGHETTVNLIGNGTLALLRHPDQLARLREDPSLIANAVDELLRFDSPVQMTRRVTLTDVEVGGRTIPKGTFVICALASANRDEAQFGPDAGDLDVSRSDASHHLSFGGGAHYCLGAALARLEGAVAIGSLVERFPAIELAGEVVWNGRINLRGLDHLPLKL
jgi:cytochrome P450